MNRSFKVSSSDSPARDATAGPRHGTGKIAYRNELARSENLAAAWRKLLPKNILVCAGPILGEAPALTVRERASAGPLDEERLRELKSGRFYAKRALALLEFHNVHIPIGPNRSPMWPRGVVGSLTHVRWRDGGHVAAAVGRASEFCGIGIDIEKEEGLHPSLWGHVLTTREYERVRTLPPPIRGVEVQLVWCAKEAFIKAIRQSIDPMEVEIERDANSYGYPATWWARTVGSSPSTLTWTGRSIRSLGFVLAAVSRGQGRLSSAAQEV